MQFEIWYGSTAVPLPGAKEIFFPNSSLNSSPNQEAETSEIDNTKTTQTNTATLFFIIRHRKKDL